MSTAPVASTSTTSTATLGFYLSREDKITAEVALQFFTQEPLLCYWESFQHATISRMEPLAASQLIVDDLYRTLTIVKTEYNKIPNSSIFVDSKLKEFGREAGYHAAILIKTILKETFGIEGSREFPRTWMPSNAARNLFQTSNESEFFNPKPKILILEPLPAPTSTALENNGNFLIDGEIIPFNKELLKQSPVINALLEGQFKESTQTTPILLSDPISLENFRILLRVLQDGTIIPTLNVDELLDLLKATKFLMLESLTQHVKKSIVDKFTPTDILEAVSAQETLNDEHIQHLIEWQLRKTPDALTDYNYVNRDAKTLDYFLTLSEKIQPSPNHHIYPLIDAIIGQIVSRCSLQESFLWACNKILELKLSVYLGDLRRGLRSDKVFYKAFYEGRKTTYKDYWKAYKKCMDDPELI